MSPFTISGIAVIDGIALCKELWLELIWRPKGTDYLSIVFKR